MTVKDLQIDSPVYRVGLDSIDIARVRLIEAFQDGSHAIELNTSWKPRCVAKTDATEIHETNSSFGVWYVNIEDAELAQLMRRSEHVEKLKKNLKRIWKPRKIRLPMQSNVTRFPNHQHQKNCNCIKSKFIFYICNGDR